MTKSRLVLALNPIGWKAADAFRLTIRVMKAKQEQSSINFDNKLKYIDPS